MDPSIMKLLEEDEDESMHSGAVVEAFQAALNRDIGGHVSTSQLSESDAAAVLSQGSNLTSSQSFLQWQNTDQGKSTGYQNQQNLEAAQQRGYLSSEMELKQQGSNANVPLQQSNNQELNCLQLQLQQSQDDHLQQRGDKVASHITQTTGLQISETNSVPVHEQDRMHNSDSQYLKLQKMSNQQATVTEQANNTAIRSKQVPFTQLMPVILPQLDKNRAMQLQTLYDKLKKNEIPKEGFVRLMRNIVGDQMLKTAVSQLHGQESPNQFQLQSKASVPQHQLRIPASNGSTTQFTDRQASAQLNQKGKADLPHASSSAVKAQTESTYPGVENTAKNSREVERHLDSHGMQVGQISSSNLSTVNQEGERSSIPIQGLSKQQQHVHFPQTSFPMYGNPGGNYHQYPGTNVNTSASSLKTQSHDPQMRQIPLHQSMGGTQLGGVSTSVPKFERQNSFNDTKRGQSGSLSQFTCSPTMHQNPVPWQSTTSKEHNPGSLTSMNYVKQELVDQANDQRQKSQVGTPKGLSSFSAPQVDQGNAVSGTMKDESLEKQSSRMDFSTSTSMVPPSSVSPSLPSQMDSNAPLGSRTPSTASPLSINARTPPKMTSVDQKKPLDSHGSSPPLPSKKQKVSGAFLDQSIDQLNDVTAVSGVNLREEEEQLFSGPKDSRVSEASRKVVQEEEEKLLLQKSPLQKKLAEIMTKCGVKNISNEVERCLSLCVEERMRGLINNLIRLSKQRVDAEKPRHRTLIVSDVRQQIAAMNRKAKEEWEKKQAEAEKLRKQNEPEDSTGADGDNGKDDGRMKSLKVNKEEDDKMRTTAANVAARAAVGGDDLLSKWQLMAEQARQKSDGGTDVASGSQPGKDTNRKSSSTSGRNTRENQDAEKRGYFSPVGVSGTSRKFGRNQVAMSQRVARSISVKDVIAALEREPQMCGSTLIYRLHEKVCSEAAAE